MNQNIINLARTSSAIDAINKGLIRCGFELEFHELNGKNRSSREEAQYDYERMRDYAEDEICDSDIIERMDYDKRNIVEHIMSEMGCSFDGVFHYLKTDSALYARLEQDRSHSRDAAVDAYIDNMDDEDKEDFLITPAGRMYDGLTTYNECTDDYIELADDSTVRGGEIKTKGPLTPTHFIRIASDILDNNDFTVATGCSFHIHLSVPGVTHIYSKRFQAEMMAYLLRNIKAMPLGVQRRLASQECRQYAAFTVKQDKYTAVHAHRYNTWEFRLFGNVKSSADARRCLIMAIDALRHAYQVKLRSKASLLGTIESESIARMAPAITEQGQCFVAVSKQIRSNDQRAVNF